MWTSGAALLLALAFFAPASAGKAYTHSWDTVGDAMAMHGKYDQLSDTVSQKDIEFVAKHYPMITT